MSDCFQQDGVPIRSQINDPFRAAMVIIMLEEGVGATSEEGSS